jgi:hypothetical protein
MQWLLLLYTLHPLPPTTLLLFAAPHMPSPSPASPHLTPNSLLSAPHHQRWQQQQQQFKAGLALPLPLHLLLLF